MSDAARSAPSAPLLSTSLWLTLILALTACSEAGGVDAGVDSTSALAGDADDAGGEPDASDVHGADAGADAVPDALSEVGDGGDAALDEGPEDPDVVDEEVTAEPIGVHHLSAVENAANVLSYFVEWRTDEAVRSDLEVTCGDDYAERFYSEGTRTQHSVLVLGLYAGASCELVARAELGARRGQATMRIEGAGPLPDYLPRLEVRFDHPGRRQPGWTLMNLADALVIGPVVVAIVDEQGRYRWYYRLGEAERQAEDHDARVVPEGILIGGRRSQPARLVDWAGNLLWTSPFNTHHDIRPLPSDPTRYLYLGEDDIGCPRRAEPESTFNELDRLTGETVFTWRACEHIAPTPYRVNWSHINGIAPYPDDRVVVLSVRNQHQLVAVDRSTGETLWVLGLGGDFEMSRGDRFLRQHAPEVQPDGNILLFDNGLPGAREYSRALELRLEFDEEGRPLRASRAWHYTDQRLFARVRSDVNRLPNGNTLITYDQVGDDLRSLFLEVTPERRVAWRVVTPPAWSTYRSERIVEPVMGVVYGD